MKHELLTSIKNKIIEMLRCQNGYCALAEGENNVLITTDDAGGDIKVTIKYEPFESKETNGQ